MSNKIAIGIVLLFLFSLAPYSNGLTLLDDSTNNLQSAGNSPEIHVGEQRSSSYSGVYGLNGTHFLFDNGSTIDIVDVESGQVVDTENCSSNPRVSGDRNYVLCNEGIYQYNNSGLHLIHNGPIDSNAGPKNNTTISVTGSFPGGTGSPSSCFGTNAWGNVRVYSGQSLISTVQFRHYSGGGSYASTSILHAYAGY